MQVCCLPGEASGTSASAIVALARLALGFDPAIVHMFGVAPRRFGYGPRSIAACRDYSRAMA
jgi:hypothetical protein